MIKLLAVASGGGHWVQLRRLQKAFLNTNVNWLTTKVDYKSEVIGNFYSVKDASLWDKPSLVIMFLQVGWIVLKIRPQVIVTTGAAPGFAAIFFGRIIGSKTVWIDSIANSEKMSTSGQRAKKIAHVTLTQWEHLASLDRPEYWGSVI